MHQQSLEAVFNRLIEEIENTGVRAYRQSSGKYKYEVTARVGQGQVNEVEEVIHKYLGGPVLQPGEEIDGLSHSYGEALAALPAHFRHKDQPLYGQAAPPHYICGVWIPFSGGATLKLVYLRT